MITSRMCWNFIERLCFCLACLNVIAKLYNCSTFLAGYEQRNSMLFPDFCCIMLIMDIRPDLLDTIESLTLLNAV